MITAMHTQLYIDGQWVDGVSKVAVYDPSDNSVITEVSMASDASARLLLPQLMLRQWRGQKRPLALDLRFCEKRLKL